MLENNNSSYHLVMFVFFLFVILFLQLGLVSSPGGGGISSRTSPSSFDFNGNGDSVEIDEFAIKYQFFDEGSPANEVDIDFLYGDSMIENFTGVGKDSDERLVVGYQNIIFDYNYDNYFVVSWNDGDSTESYLMRASNFRSGADNTTDFQYYYNAGWYLLSSYSKDGDVVSIGNVELEVGAVNVLEKTVVVDAGSNKRFDRLYDLNDYYIDLPNATSLPVSDYYFEVKNLSGSVIDLNYIYWNNSEVQVNHLGCINIGSVGYDNGTVVSGIVELEVNTSIHERCDVGAANVSVNVTDSDGGIVYYNYSESGYFYGEEDLGLVEGEVYTVSSVACDDAGGCIREEYSIVGGVGLNSVEFLGANGVDTDDDGLYDYMVLNLSVYVNASGYYDVRGYVGKAVEQDTISIYGDSVRDIDYSYYFKGYTNVSLNFSSENITRDDANGGLFVEYILIEKAGGDRSDSILNESIGLARGDFDPYPIPEINFINFTDYGVDVDDDEHYDYLVINVTLNVSEDEVYSIYARVEDGLSRSNRFYFDEDFNLTSGINLINFNYSGEEINYFLENSTYIIDRLSVDYNDGQGSLEIYDNTSDVYTTRLYNYTEFDESARGEVIGVVDEYANDTDSDGLYDNLNLVFQVNVSATGNYTLDVEFDSYSSFDEQQEEELQEGINNITISVNGLQIYYEEINSTLNVSEVSFRCDYELDYEEDFYETTSYNYTDFERPSYIINITNDYANDTDADGLYDALVLELELNVTRDNNCTTHYIGNVEYGNTSSEIAIGSDFSYLTEGVQNLNFMIHFPGIDSVAMGGFNFSEIHFTEEGYSGWYGMSYNSSIYNYSDFEHPSNIEHSVFNGGTTSNFTNGSNVSNLTLEIVETGKISFLEDVNLSGGADFDSNVIIAKRFISVNSSALPSLNKSARLTFEGLIGDDVEIYRNGVLCGAYCSNIDYSDGVLTFDVSGFSNYSVVETFDAPAVVVDDGDGGSGGGGGGGGGGSAGVVNVSEVNNEDILFVSDNQSESDSETLADGLNGVIENDSGFLFWIFVFLGVFIVGVLFYKGNRKYRSIKWKRTS